MTTRAGFAAIIGAPNAGKSTLTNRLVGAKVSIVTQKVQTTRFPVRGVAMAGSSQIVLVDTPGIFQPRRRLDRAMIRAAWGGAQDADVIVHLVDSVAELKAPEPGATSADKRSAIDVASIVEGLKTAGKQARDDGAQLSDNVVGDAVEALIGAIYCEAGLEGATVFVRRAWDGKLDRGATAPKHPKSALQEWAAARQCAPPVYTLVGQHGPHHAPLFTVKVEVGGKRGGSATAEGASKQEAEKAAALAMLSKHGGAA